MKKIIDYLSRLDFSETEVKLYLILLKAGSMTVAELARKAGINRTATYGYINTLLTKGVIAQAKGASNKIIANPPAQLHYLVDQKISSANILKEDLMPIVTLLNSSYMKSKAEPDSDMRYYKGKNNVKAIYLDILKSNKIRAYYNPEDIIKTFPENTNLFEAAIDKNPKLEVYEIIQNSKQSQNYANLSANNISRHYWKFLPQDIKLTANDILIYSGKVAIINIGDENNITGVVLDNEAYYNNSVQLFDLLWRLLPHQVRR